MYRSVKKNIYTIAGSPITLIIRCEDNTFLIDPGLGLDKHKVINEVLNRLNISNYDILISHAHYDHIEALQYFLNRRIYVNEVEFSQLINSSVREHATYGYNPLPNLMKLQHISLLSDNIITVSLNRTSKLGCIELLDLSGHSPGLIGVILDDAVFVGDALFGDVLLSRVGIPYHSDVFKAFRIIENVLKPLSEEGFEAILSHGPIVRGTKFSDLIELNLRRIETVVDITNKLLYDGGTIERLTVRVLKSLNVELNIPNIYLGSVTIASIISKLCEDSLVESVVSDDGVIWRLKKY